MHISREMATSFKLLWTVMQLQGQIILANTIYNCIWLPLEMKLKVEIIIFYFITGCGLIQIESWNHYF